MKQERFQELYKGLNKEQRAAVDTLYGPVVVIAGPGTGKTSILTLRIANILRKTDTPADAILALSFTESGVAAMRRKLLDIIGPRAYEVRLHTFHSFANDLIKKYPEEFERIIGSEHMEHLEQIRIVEELIAKHASERLRPKNNPHYYVLPVIDAIKTLKREGISPEAFSALIKKEKGEKKEKEERNRELLKIYRTYEKELRAARLYDFEDMVGEASRALAENTDFKLRLQEEHQFVLADEHQDANESQNRLLELLCDYDQNPNLFIVGDAKQAIFRFQGASLQNFLYFEKKFPKARIITLADNYRSAPHILAGAHALMGQAELPERFREKLTARAVLKNIRCLKPATSDVMTVAEAPSEDGELAHLAESVHALIESGVPPREIAVLARENKDAEKAEDALRRRGIIAARRGDTDALESVRIDALRQLFAAAAEPHRDELLAPILFFDFLTLPPMETLAAVHAREGGVLLARLGGGAHASAPLAAFQKKMLRWHRVAQNEPLVAAFETIAHESGFLETALARTDADEILRLYGAFLESARRFAERNKRALLADFLERLARAEAHGIPLLSSIEREGGVAVMTAHKAKGLEFDFVFIIFAHDGKWGGKRSRALFALPLGESAEAESDHDERRLFYVALTRARKGVHISWHARGENGRALLPSRFIFEMDEKTREHISLQNSLSPLRRPADEAGARGTSRIRILQSKNYLNSLFLEQGFAVTHLNNLLECPLKYFFLNLVRLPRAQSGAELYGQAIHAALAAHFTARARDADKPFKDIARIFEGALRRTHLAEADFKAYLAAGKKELRGYFASQTFPRNCWSEYRIGGVFLSVVKEKIELTGMLDRVDLLAEGGVAVVDYKTGRPKTRNEIEGKTKSADGNYYRQLVFYKLLVDESKRRSGSADWRMKTGAIDFIKPDAKGKYKREVFVISDTEVAALKKQITAVAAQILDLSFLKNGCNQRDCAWCRLASAAGW